MALCERVTALPAARVGRLVLNGEPLPEGRPPDCRPDLPPSDGWTPTRVPPEARNVIVARVDAP